MDEKKTQAKSKELYSRRDFMQLLALSFGGVGGGLALWPFIHALNPRTEQVTDTSIEVDLGDIAQGQSKTVMWKGKPVFIRKRTQEEIQAARSVDIKTLPHKQTDEARVQRPEWLVAVGVCTHLGCVPAGQKAADNKGEFGGWFCQCHGSHFDTSGRIRKGPAPKNLVVPPYEFINDTKIKIG
ncbi:MAG: ubiquinol-cytochrome c reductase iron-sulfur subunit [Alphaproteobacteria bacterium]